MATPSVFQVDTEDGWSLAVEHLPAQGEVRGAALLMHAMMVDRRSMLRAGFGPFLASQGWNVYAADFRGRGGSGKPPREGTRWSYDDLVFRDLPALVAGVRAHAGEQFLYLIGHSLGGHTGLAAAGSHAFELPPDGYVLLSVNMWRPGLEPDWKRRALKRLQLELFAGMTWPRGYFPSRRLRMGPCDEPRPYVLDLARCWRRDSWSSADGVHDYDASMKQVAGPVLAVIGKGDTLMAHPVAARNWTEQLGPERADFWVVGRGDHQLDFDPDHMTVVTAEASRPLWDAITNWMRRHGRRHGATA